MAEAAAAEPVKVIPVEAAKKAAKPRKGRKGKGKGKAAETEGGEAKAPRPKKTSKGKAEEGEGRKRRKHYDNYSMFIYKILHQVHPDAGCSKKAMKVMDDLAHDFVNALTKQADELSAMNKRMTLSSRDVQGAVRLVLPGELAKHAVSEGNKAVTMYNKGMSE